MSLTRAEADDDATRQREQTDEQQQADEADHAEKHERAQSQDQVTPRSHDSPDAEELTPETAFRRTVEEGRRRLDRRPYGMLSTGIVGGLDIGTGVLALLLIEDATGSKLLGGLGFSIAFIALLLAQSELFTEGFLVPVAAVAARKSRLRDLLKLYAITIIGNLLGGWAIMWVIVQAFPELQAVALETGTHFAELGFDTRSASLALLAGASITLMTWMQNATSAMSGKLAAAVAIGFLLAGAQLFHSILDSLLMFGALLTGEATFGYVDWLGAFAWAALFNTIGGLGLVTGIRFLQVSDRIKEERERPEMDDDGSPRGRRREAEAKAAAEKALDDDPLPAPD